MTSFKILHSFDGLTFHYLVDGTGAPEIFSGGFDSRTPVQSVFKVPVETKFVRVYPVTWQESIALRVEILGCRPKLTIRRTTTTTPAPTTLPPTTTLAPVTVTIVPAILCDDPMGVENGKMHPSQVSFSTYKEALATAIQQNPISVLKLSAGKGWMPLVDSQNEFVQFDFLEPSKITGLETKGGEYGWVKAFHVLYSKDNVVWNTILDDKNEKPKIFLANVDTENTKSNYFKYPVNARYLKVKPIKWYNSIEMKVEPLGCFKPYRKLKFTF